MNKKHSIFALLFAIFVLSACTSNESNEPKKNEEANQEKITVSDFNLELSKDTLTVSNWLVDNSHMEEVTGKVTTDNGEAVSGISLQVDKKRMIETDEQGEFSFLVDRSILTKKVIHFISADNATVSGKQLDKPSQDKLLSLKGTVDVLFPLEILEVNDSKNREGFVEVKGKAALEEGQEFPSFGAAKFIVSGVVTDHNGTPLKDAHVNLRRDGVEGYSMSNASNEDGFYTMYYLPDEEEGHYMNVVVDGQTYSLPENKVFNFPEQVSIELNIQLPKEGNIITDEPPFLTAKTQKGALFTGTLIALDVAEDVDYKVTIPEKDGTFVMEVPKDVWETNPTFYQLEYLEELIEPITNGEWINNKFIPEPIETTPTGIVPAQ